jgi:hypothetical protein
MNKLNINVIIGLLFIAGIWVFIYGQFIISTVLFGSAFIYSNIATRVKLNS